MIRVDILKQEPAREQTFLDLSALVNLIISNATSLADIELRLRNLHYGASRQERNGTEEIIVSDTMGGLLATIVIQKVASIPA